MILLVVIYILVFVIFLLVAFSVAQIKAAGMKVKDFWSFIEANQMLDKLYKFSRKYEKLNNQEQIIFLEEEKMGQSLTLLDVETILKVKERWPLRSSLIH